MSIQWKSCFRICLSAFLLYLCIHYWTNVSSLIGVLIGAATPLFVGCAIAYVVNILMNLYERYYFPKSRKTIVLKSRRPICMIGAFVTVVVIVLLVIFLIAPQLRSCIELLIWQLPDAVKIVADWVEKWDILPEDIIGPLFSIDWKNTISQILNVLATGVGNVVEVVVWAVSSVVSGVVTAIVSIIFAIYILTGKEKLGQQGNRLMHRYMKPRWCEKFIYVLSVLDRCFHKYIVGQCTEAVILGILCMVGMWILRLPYAPMIGALIGFTALIPVAGAYIGGGVGAFIILMESPIKAGIFLVFLVVLQQFEGNIIYPKVVGSSIGLPAIWVLAAVTVGGGLMGILGMLLAVPVAATIYTLLKNNVNQGNIASQDTVS